MSVVGIIPMDGDPNDNVVGEDFRVCLTTKVSCELSSLRFVEN